MKVIHYIFLVSSLFCLLSCSDNSNIKEVSVVDKVNLLSSSQINTIDSLYKSHEKITSNEIALIIAAELPDSSILKSATELGNIYGVGKKDINNGVVILVCPSMRKVAIATGKGTERVLKDEIAKKIIDSLMIPRFSEGEYFQAIWNGSLGIVNFLELPQNKIIN